MQRGTRFVPNSESGRKFQTHREAGVATAARAICTYISLLHNERVHELSRPAKARVCFWAQCCNGQDVITHAKQMFSAQKKKRKKPASYKLCKFKTLNIARCKHTKQRTNLKKKRRRRKLQVAKQSYCTTLSALS